MVVSAPVRQERRWLQFAVAGVIVLVTLGVYWQLRGHKFVSLDDPKYVTENPHVLKGLTLQSAKWAFTTKHASNWHPLTWLSLMLDCELSGAKAETCHTTNLLLHVANALLLFVLLKCMTGSVWPSGFVAALFALHPLHVESVAWVAERKDVLSTFFWLLTMLAYARYTQRPALIRYMLVVILFALGLMAKPMLVTLPFVLLLLDYWPLKRLELSAVARPDTNNPKRQAGKKQTFFRLVSEKVPLFILSAVSCVITLRVQQDVEVSARLLSIYGRISNAMVSYMVYLCKMIWPVRLAVFYPHPKTLPPWQVAVAGLLLLVISALVIRRARSRKYAIVGWLWYLGTLVPVIGLVQVGIQSYADRYTYVPLIGIFIVIAWGLADLFAKRPASKPIATVAAAFIVVALAVCTWIQTGYWHSSVTLYEHALQVTWNNHLAHNNLGVVLRDQGRIAEAVEHFEAAAKIFPMYDDAVVNLAAGLVDQGRFNEAIDYCTQFLQRRRGNCKLHNNLANALKAAGRIDEAIQQYYKALEFDKNAWQVHCNLGMIMAARGKINEALKHYRAASKANPNHPAVRNGLEAALAKKRALNQKEGSRD